MTFLRRFLDNHVLANLTFAVVLVVGAGGYHLSMPREQDPEINFNWISVVTTLPGASAEDVEKLVTKPLEDAIRKVSDIKFVSSNSRESVSSILVRFTDISQAVFDKRINDLRREVQNKANEELPPEAEDPSIVEVRPTPCSACCWCWAPAGCSSAAVSQCWSRWGSRSPWRGPSPCRAAPRGADPDHLVHDSGGPVLAGDRPGRKVAAVGAGRIGHHVGPGVRHHPHAVRYTPAVPHVMARRGEPARPGRALRSSSCARAEP
jgi:hypothetical protein